MVPTSKVGKITSSPVRILNFQRQIPGAFSPHIAHASVTSEARHQRVFAFQVDARLGSVASHSWRSRHELFLLCGERHTQKSRADTSGCVGARPSFTFSSPQCHHHPDPPTAASARETLPPSPTATCRMALCRRPREMPRARRAIPPHQSRRDRPDGPPMARA